MQLQLGDALPHGDARPGQKAGAHPVGDGAEPQVNARGLDLIGRKLLRRRDGAVRRQRRDHAVGQDAVIG